MKLSFFSASLAVLCVLLFSNCSKNDSNNPITAITSDYSPLSEGSSWTYKNIQGSATDTFKLTATNKDTVANGKTYKVLTSTDSVNRYMGKSGSDYYRFQSFPSVGITNFEELYLKDNLDVNGTWTNTTSFTYPGVPGSVTATLNYKIQSKDTSLAVNGTTFTNVIHVKLDISVLLVGSIGTGDFYYAKGVGLIQDTISITPPAPQPAITISTELIASDIK